MRDQYPQIDVRSLVEKYPNLAENVVDGAYDFSKSENQYQLAEKILEEYFGFSVRFSRNHLCPRVPNRLEYIKFCEALIEENDGLQDGWSIDVGTGSSVIYPLLAAGISKTNRFIGTDINEDSLSYASMLVESTSLGDRIKLLKASKDELIPTQPVLELVQNKPIKYVVCNPPFYKDEQDVLLHESFKPAKPNELIIARSELCTAGGEVDFIKKLISQTCRLSATQKQFNNTWFTSQVGIYRDIVPIYEHLQSLYRSHQVSHFLFHRIPFKTSRWVVVWNCSPWRPPAWLATSQSEDCVRFNRKVFLSSRASHKHDLHHVHDLLRKQLGSITADCFRYSLRWRDDSVKDCLYVETNEPIWLRKTSRALRFQPQKLAFSTRVLFRVSVNYITLLHGSHAHLRPFADYIGRISVPSNAGQSG